jgi:Flp pilus assembly pilin Flp
MFNKKQKGQGVVEYAGALVIAAIIVTTVIVTGPDNLSAMFDAVIADVQGAFTGAIN